MTETGTEAAAQAPRKLTPEEVASLCAQIADDRKATNIIRLKLAEFSSISDYVVICTGTSAPHLGAVAERIQREMRNNYKLRPAHVDGNSDSGWVIIDFGAVAVHVMTEETRNIYQLESLWGDAPRVEAVKKLTGAAKKLRKDSAETPEKKPAKKSKASKE